MSAELPYKQTLISDRTYHVQIMPARAGGELFVELLGAIGPGIATVFDTIKASGGELGTGDVTVIGQAIADAVGKLTPEGFTRAADKLLARVKMDCPDGTQMPCPGHALDAQFAGDMYGYLNLVYFAAEANFGRFFSKALERVAASKATKK